MTAVEWHGTTLEAEKLDEALRRNCECKFGLMGVRQSTCPSHQALLDDQRFMDGLVFERRYWATHSPHAGQRVILIIPVPR